MRKAFFLLLVVGCTAIAQQTPSFNLTVTGEKTWTIRFGLGSAGLLADESLSPGQPALTQSLRAEITGTALDLITLTASFNDQLGPEFQDFLLTVDHTPWTGELGRFVVGAEGEGLGVYNKRVLGARGTYAGAEVTVGALVTRLEGISESRTFYGERGTGEATFTVNDPDEPWRPAPYLRSVEGLAYWPLRIQFVEGLSEVALRVDGSAALWAFLADWGLGYLEEDLAAELVTPLAAGEFFVLRDGGDDLALRLAPAALARRRIQEAIEAHNTRLGLTGNDRRTYPLIEGSELEARFLDEWSAFLAVLVDEDAYPFPEAQYRRYLSLGERDVIEDTVEVWIRLPGEEEFRPSTDPDLAEFAWTILPADGVLRISFPDGFFTDGALRVTFAFQREGGSFALGLSLVPGSERVYRNGKLLVRNTDYTLDYEAGILLLFAPLGPEDELRVDFERQRGGLGVVTDYERILFGLTVNVPGWDALHFAVYRAMDFGTPLPTTRTMPNTHTVAALALAGEVAGWAYSLSVAAAENVFPSDDNARIPSPNRVHAISAAQAPDGAYVIFGHQNGLTVYKDGAFTGYGAAHGLAGRAVSALLALPGQLLVGTDGGLTVVRLTEPTPFDRVRSWVRITKDDGLPGTEVLALASGDGLVYVATDAGLASFALADAENPKRWQPLTLPADDTRPTSLLWAAGVLYLGAADGLYVQSEAGWIHVPEAPGPIHDLLARGDDVYVASDHGIRILRGGMGAGWVVLGKAVYDLALYEGALWYAAEDGLWHEGGSAPAVGGPVTAVGVGQGAVWAASIAGEDFRLDLWRVGERAERFTQSQTKLDGRDLSRFRDIPAAEHTRYGISGGLYLSRTFGDWQWDVRLASRLPGYEEIGRSGRSDGHGISFTARYTGAGPTTLELRGGWDVVNLTTRPQSRLTASLDWRWSDGPTASLSVTPTVTGSGVAAFERLEMGWRAGLSNTTQAWSWGLSTSGTLRYPSFSAAGQLGATASLQPAPGWTTDISWTRPVRTTGTLGEETLRATVKWASALDRISLNASWQESLRHHLTTDAWRSERTIQADARWPAWPVPGGDLTPRLFATLSETPTEERWTARLEADLVQSPVVLRLKVTVGRGLQVVTERTDQTLALSFAWEHAGWRGVRTSLQWDRSWALLSHPRYPTEVTEKEEAVLRLTWEPEGWRDVLTLSWKPRDQQISVTNRGTWPFASGALTAETSVQLKDQALDVTTRADLGLPLDTLLVALGAEPVGEMWGLSAELGHILGLTPESDATHALFLGVTLAVRF